MKLVASWSVAWVLLTILLALFACLIMNDVETLSGNDVSLIVLLSIIVSAGILGLLRGFVWGVKAISKGNGGA